MLHLLMTAGIVTEKCLKATALDRIASIMKESVVPFVSCEAGGPDVGQWNSLPRDSNAMVQVHLGSSSKCDMLP